MYYEYNKSYLANGYIKELLKDFNLPKFEVYKSDDNCFKNKFYLKDGYIQFYDGEWERLQKYVYGRAYKNLTTKLDFCNTSYDTKTHEYLGNYLRFIRDYRGLDLMSLYNCFSWNSPKQLQLSFDDKHFSKNSDNVYYLVPIKFNQEYTIAFSSIRPVEICAVMYDNVLDNSSLYKKDGTKSTKYISTELARSTYKKINESDFFNPFIFNAQLLEDYKEQFGAKYQSLKLLLKLPSDFSSSLVILEGNYLDCTSHLLGSFSESRKTIDDNGSIITKPNVNTLSFNQKIDVSNYKINNLNTRLSLLQVNDGLIHPFADRLIEYLSGNVITQVDECEENIKRVQNAINSNLLGYKGIWTDQIRSKIYSMILEKSKTNQRLKNTLNNTLDSQFYIDKDIETMLGMISAYNLRYTEE